MLHLINGNLHLLHWQVDSLPLVPPGKPNSNNTNINNTNYLNLNNVNTSNTTIMTRMFQQSLMTTLDISSFDLSNVEDAELMFYAMDNLTTIYATEDTVFSGLNIPITTSLFDNDRNLVGGKGSKITNNVSDNSFEYAHIDGGTANPGYFTLKQN